MLRFFAPTGRHFGFVVIFLGLASHAHSAEYFVALDGSDSGIGSNDRPFRTIQKAADAAKPGDTCYVRWGLYRQVIRPKRSGTFKWQRDKMPPLGRTENNYRGDDPNLTDPAAYDFRPQPGSPLVDAGRPIKGFTDGYHGRAPDIGTYEFGGQRWLPSGLDLEFVCEHLGGARVFDLAAIDLQLGIAFPFDRLMLSTTPAKLAPHAKSK